jgi:enterochelin esterase-like enzyme
VRTVATLTLTLVCLAGAGHGEESPGFPSFDDFARRYRKAAAGERADLMRALVADRSAHGGFPIVEAGDSGVVFVYAGSGQEKTVEVIGDFRTRSYNVVSWNNRGLPLERLVPGAPVFFARMAVEPDARLDYQFAVDGKYQPDPLNERGIVSGAAPSPGGDGEKASVLMMPRYPLAPATVPRADVAHGQTIVVDEPWATPKVTIYLPAGFDSNHRYPVVYTADGRQWREFINLPSILDNLIAGGGIEPLIAVMIDSAADRGEWYQLGSAYAAYLDKVVAFVDAHYPTRARVEDRLHIGSSAGGRATLSIALERPAMFARFAMFSPSLFAPPHYYEPLLTGKKRLGPGARIFLSAGSYEGYILDDAHLFERVLRRAGARVRTAYTHEGHSFGTTRNLVPEMLTWMFPARAPNEAVRAGRMSAHSLTSRGSAPSP